MFIVSSCKGGDRDRDWGFLKGLEWSGGRFYEVEEIGDRYGEVVG